MPLDSTSPEPNFNVHHARWTHYENPDAVCFQIELGNGRAVTLSCSKTGAAPSVVLWHGNAERLFNGENPDRFRAWLEDAARRQ